MPLASEEKARIVSQFGRGEQDTGSSVVQIALLTRRILELAKHCKLHQKDHASRRGLLKMVGARRKLLKYLKRKNIESYRTLIAELGLRK